MKEYDGDVTGEEVKKKIASLRACYRRERRKVEAFKRSGAGADHYEPSLFYWKEMDFLNDQDEPAESVSSIEVEDGVSIASFFTHVCIIWY